MSDVHNKETHSYNMSSTSSSRPSPAEKEAKFASFMSDVHNKETRSYNMSRTSFCRPSPAEKEAKFAFIYE